MAARTLAIACAVSAALASVSARAEPAIDPTTAWALAAFEDSSNSPNAGPKNPPKLGVTAEGQLGLVLARGNTDTTTANAKFELVRTTTAVKDDFEIEGLYGKTGEIVTAERWATNLQRNWSLTDRVFWFVNARYEHDLFSGFAYQATGATGVGYKFIDTDSTRLAAQVGGGYRRLRPETLIENAEGQVTGRIEGDPEGEAVANGRIDFEHTFNAQTKISDTVLTVVGSENRYLENDLALGVKIYGSLSLSVGYTVRNNSNPPDGLKHTDTLTTINLVYQMK